MNRRRCLLGSLLALSCGCSSRQPAESSSVAAESTGSTESAESETETNTGGAMDLGAMDMGTPMTPCTTEWDCGVGERCLEGSCECLGCGCSGWPIVAPGTIDESVDEESLPVWLDIGEPECGDDSDCEPLEFCDGYQCVETTACVEELDCFEDWPGEDRFCVDGLCRPLDCDEFEGDLGCPEVALCEYGCRWIEVVPACVDTLSFDEVIADTLITPDAAIIVVIDLDVDGRDDLAVIDDQALHWVMSNGVGFDAPTPWVAEPDTHLVGLGRADIHGDGIDELLVSHVGVVGVEILVLGEEAGPTHAGFVETVHGAEVVTTMDVDHDGLPDLVSGSTSYGLTTGLEVQLGDGSGTFGPLWDEHVESFEWVGLYSAFPGSTCGQHMASVETDFLGARHLDHEGVGLGTLVVFRRPVVGQMLFGEAPTHSAGIVAAAPLVDGGVLYVDQFTARDRFVELLPEPGEVAFVSPGGETSYVIIERGVETAEFVELSGSPLAPVCRGDLGLALDVAELQVGDFDGDGREDLIGRGHDGLLRVWYSRE